jgi:hypothetical protein
MAAMVALLTAILAAIGSAWCGRLVDRRLAGTEPSPRRIVSITLLAASVWLMVLIELAHALEIPGYYGTVQYWTHADGSVSPFFHVRALAMLVVLGSTLAAFVVAIATFGDVWAGQLIPRWRLCMVPLAALASFAIALQLFGSRQFFPLV